MVLSNIYTRPDPVDLTPRVPFTSLKWGERFKYSHKGGIHQVFFIGPDWITVRRADDWLVRINKDSEAWNKNVITI